MADRSPLIARLRWLILVALTLVVFGLLFSRIHLGQVVDTITTASAGYLLLAAALSLTFPVMSAVRWQLVLRNMGYRVSAGRCYAVIMAVWPVSSVSPSKSGDLLKAYYLRRTVPAAAMVGTVLAERALDVAALALLSLAGAVALARWDIAMFAAPVLAVCVAVGVAVRRRAQLPLLARWQERLDQLLLAARMLETHPWRLAAVLTLTFSNWLASVIQAQVLFLAVGASVSPLLTLAGLPVAIFVGLIPVTLAGMGTRESAMVVLFGASAGAPEALAVGLLYTFFSYWFLSLVGLPFTLAESDRQPTRPRGVS